MNTLPGYNRLANTSVYTQAVYNFFDKIGYSQALYTNLSNTIVYISTAALNEEFCLGMQPLLVLGTFSPGKFLGFWPSQICEDIMEYSCKT